MNKNVSLLIIGYIADQLYWLWERENITHYVIYNDIDLCLLLLICCIQMS